MDGMQLYERFLFARRRLEHAKHRYAVYDPYSPESDRAKREITMWERVVKAHKERWTEYARDHE